MAWNIGAALTIDHVFCRHTKRKYRESTKKRRLNFKGLRQIASNCMFYVPNFDVRSDWQLDNRLENTHPCWPLEKIAFSLRAADVLIYFHRKNRAALVITRNTVNFSGIRWSKEKRLLLWEERRGHRRGLQPV